MGRKPNALILQFFERGPKLADHSNRYPHTCKACGENFPKGRIDSLTNHLTKKCPAISEADRVRACLTIHGFTRVTAERSSENVLQANNHAGRSSGGTATTAAAEAAQDHDMLQRDWTALETLAEVSRQIDLSEKHDDRGNPIGGSTAGGAAANTSQSKDRFDYHDRLASDGNPPAYAAAQPTTEIQEGTAQDQASGAYKEDLSTEQQIRALLQSGGSVSNASVYSVAAAATARLNPSLLDPQLREELSLAVLPSSESQQPDEPSPTATTSPSDPPISAPISAQTLAPTSASIPTSIPESGQSSSQPWGELTQGNTVPDPMAVSSLLDPPLIPGGLKKGGIRLSSPNGGKARHARSRFDDHRRKEVQEVRKIGACIRCRILRKTCSKGHPCDTCRKVLSPRIWKSGCVRTKFSEQLDLYSAGVQIVLAQNKINEHKAAVSFTNQGTVIQVSLFPENNVHIQLEALQGTRGPGNREAETEAPEGADRHSERTELLMVDYEKEDVPTKVELYMRQVMSELVAQEKSRFVRVTVETAIHLAQESNDELLKKAIELWGLVEILDRERQWHIMVQYSNNYNNNDNNNNNNGNGDAEERPSRWVNHGEKGDVETYGVICLQLTAAAERKAAATSRSLLAGMQRVLQDSKAKIDRNMFFTTLILLHCIEKTTWSFKMWERDDLRPSWPLGKPPSNFNQQGYVLADLLRMLLSIRKALPRTYCHEPDGRLVFADADPILQQYFLNLNLQYAEVLAKQDNPVFSPTDSRSLELLFCSILLLP